MVFFRKESHPSLLKALVGQVIFLLTPISRFIDLPNNRRLPYGEQGEPSGIAVVFVHAIVDSCRPFEPVIAHLPNSNHTFALTQRGHGEASRPPSGYRVLDFTTDLAAFMDAMSLKSAVIVGGSNGGLTARRFAINYPERTLGLVLLGTPASLQNKPGVSELWDAVISKLTDPVDPRFVRESVAGMLINPLPEAFYESLVEERNRPFFKVNTLNCQFF